MVRAGARVTVEAPDALHAAHVPARCDDPIGLARQLGLVILAEGDGYELLPLKASALAQHLVRVEAGVRVGVGARVRVGARAGVGVGAKARVRVKVGLRVQVKVEW